jgi:uncharacterized membrane protein
MRFLPSFLLLLLCSACGSGDRSLVDVDPGAAPERPTYEMVAAILDRACVPCHSGGGSGGGGDNRPGGFIPAEDDGGPYDTCQGIVEDLEGILDTAVDGGSMPPGAWPRLDERERLIIRRWIDQGACAPCRSCP